MISPPLATRGDGPFVSLTTGPGDPVRATPALDGTLVKTASPVKTSSPVAPSTATATPTTTSTSTPTSTPTPTPTVTALWPTDTPTATPTWASSPDCGDLYEPNDQPGAGPILVNNEAISSLTLFPLGDRDFFRLWGKGGAYYQIATQTSEGVDTRLRIFDPVGALIAENDDHQPGDPASEIRFQAPGEGWFSVVVDSRVPADWGCRQYQISAVTAAPPTASPTPTQKRSEPQRAPTATPRPTDIPAELTPDNYEPNYDFGSAANIGVGQTLSLNFNPFPAGTPGVDNDFFRLYVKVGQELVIETNNLAPGLDTNLILYLENGEAIAGNDDCQPGDLRSCLEWAPDFTGVAYILAGPAGTIPETVSSGARAYILSVKDVVGSNNASDGSAGDYGQASGSDTSSAGSQRPMGTSASTHPWKVTPLPPTSTPLPSPTPTSTPLPSPTPTATPVVQVRSIPMGPPTSTPRPPQAIAIELSIYQDQNDNRAQDSDEAVRGVSVRVLDSQSNQLLGYTLTDDYGHASLTVAAPGEVRLSVPFLAYNERVRPPGGDFVIRLTPLRLPSLIP